MKSVIEEKELIKLMSDFYGKDYIETTLEEKQKMHNAYRKVEEETNIQIEKAGGVRNWYESGEGRLFKF